jgi:hypothetical protein
VPELLQVDLTSQAVGPQSDSLSPVLCAILRSSSELGAAACTTQSLRLVAQVQKAISVERFPRAERRSFWDSGSGGWWRGGQNDHRSDPRHSRLPRVDRGGTSRPTLA